MNLTLTSTHERILRLLVESALRNDHPEVRTSGSNLYEDQ